ncbi:hypothetical protein JVT61DRAFT_8765 [Boletus reticuloceps]|uniref:DH domain-containing protein n=1 Tax=Boletus reticuloceps TaxID=495285 RepID=A0A8I2YHW6_9AGAM|nr:hypothetical protein JVT61DRAFT_8765 [Boletus reticuloceps]
MAQQWSSRSRVKPPRSPALRTPTTPSQFFPPSYFAAAASVLYPPNRDESISTHDQSYHSLSSNASYRVTECSPNPSRTRRKSQLGNLEPQLLPTLSDTVERMTRPPSQLVSSSPFRPIPGPSSSPSIARTPSTSSQGSSAYSVRSETCSVADQTPTIQPTQPPLRSPSTAYPTQPPSRPSSSRSPNPKSILKSHTISDRHLQVRQTLDDVCLPTRKAGRSPIPIPPEPLPSDSRIEHARQIPISSRPKIDPSLRTGRARSRTDPGTLPKGLPSAHGRNAQQPNPQPSGIPRRVGVPSSPATTRTPQASINGSDVGSVNSIQPEKQRLFVTNAEIPSSSSSASQVALTRYIKPKTLSRTDSQSSTESQLRTPRFGLGLGLSGVNKSQNTVKFSPGQRWLPRDESYMRRTNSPSNKRHPREKRYHRLPSRNTRVDSTDGQRRRELLSLMHPDLYDSSGCDSQPSSSEGSEDRCLVSDGSGDSLRSAFDDSGSEYSPTEERRNSTRWENRPEQTRSKAARQSRVNLPELPTHVDEQYTPRASSTPSYLRHEKGQTRGYPTATAHDEEFLETESSTVVSDEDANSINETETHAIPKRYSSELSRIMAVSIAAAERQRQAFGISSSPDLEDHEADSSQLPHADSDVSLIGGHRWQDDCDELATGSLLQQLDQTCGTDGRESDSRPLSTGELSLSSAQTHSSVSQESIYSTSNSPTRRLSQGIVVQESPPAIPTVRDQQWQTFERHVLDSYGEVEAQRQRFIWEFTESEDNFVTQLQNMIQLFISPLRVRDTRMWVSGIPGDVTKLFDWLDDIVRVHAQLSSTLVSRQIVDHPRLQIISEVFRGFVPRLETYQPYLVKLEFTASVIDGLTHEGKNDFGDFIKLQEALERCQGWSLEKYLIEPVNRLAQYPEVFRRLLQLTPKSHPDYLSTLSLFHAAKLTIRVLSEVKDREDAYELVKMACSGIKGISPMHLVHRERRLLIRGSLTCVQVSNDQQALSLETPADNQPAPRSVGQQRIRRADKLSKAIHVWCGRSNSIKSSASTVVSFGTAPSSFDVHLDHSQPALGTPVVRVESAPVNAEVLVFSDLVLFASRHDSELDGEDGVDSDVCDLEPLDGFGVSRIVSVLDEMGTSRLLSNVSHLQKKKERLDRRACITLDLAPLTSRALEEGYVQSTGPVVTISLSRPRSQAERASAPLSDWLAPLRHCCQYTQRTLSSLHTTHVLIDRAASATAAQKPALSSILAAGLPFPKSPSMQIQESERGLASDSERQEREERGWWSKRFHEVFAELSAHETVLC